MDKEIKERRAEAQRQEKRLVQKEESLDKKMDILENKENQLQEKMLEVEKERAELDNFKDKQIAELEKISGLTKEDAKNYMITILKDSLSHDLAIIIQKLLSLTFLRSLSMHIPKNMIKWTLMIIKIQLQKTQKL